MIGADRSRAHKCEAPSRGDGEGSFCNYCTDPANSTPFPLDQQCRDASTVTRLLDCAQCKLRIAGERHRRGWPTRSVEAALTSAERCCGLVAWVLAYEQAEQTMLREAA